MLPPFLPVMVLGAFYLLERSHPRVGSCFAVEHSESHDDTETLRDGHKKGLPNPRVFTPIDLLLSLKNKNTLMLYKKYFLFYSTSSWLFQKVFRQEMANVEAILASYYSSNDPISLPAPWVLKVFITKYIFWIPCAADP